MQCLVVYLPRYALVENTQTTSSSLHVFLIFDDSHSLESNRLLVYLPHTPPPTSKIIFYFHKFHLYFYLHCLFRHSSPCSALFMRMRISFLHPFLKAHLSPATATLLTLELQKICIIKRTIFLRRSVSS